MFAITLVSPTFNFLYSLPICRIHSLLLKDFRQTKYVRHVHRIAIYIIDHFSEKIPFYRPTRDTKVIFVLSIYISDTTLVKEIEMLPDSVPSREKSIQHLNKACEAIQQTAPYSPITNNSKAHQIYTVRRYNFAVCLVPKAGCSFVKQLVHFLNYQSLINDPPTEELSDELSEIKPVFNLSRKLVHRILDFGNVTIPISNFTREQNLIKVVMVRNPYSRLFSAYVDKIFIPHLWRKLIGYKYMLNDTFNDTICELLRHETFESFLQQIVWEPDLENWDKHWLPVHNLCDPCNAQPHLIIHQETYNEDIKMLLQKTGILKSERTILNKYMAKYGVQNRQTLKGLIVTTYSIGVSQCRHCLTRFEMAERVWKALQIQGQVLQQSLFPKKKLYNITDLDAEQVSDILLAEIDKAPISSKEAHAQRDQALRLAYRNVSKSVLKEIQNIFSYDFQIFGYDMDPPI